MPNTNALKPPFYSITNHLKVGKESDILLKFTSDYIVKIPVEYRREFVNEICRDNLSRMIIVASILTVVGSLSAFFADTFWFNTYHVALCAAVLNLLLIPILYQSKSKIKELSVVWIMVVQTIYVVVVLSAGLFWSLFEQSEVASAGPYMLTMYAISALAVMPPLVSASLLLIFSLAFSFMVSFFQPVPEAAILLRMHVCAMSVLAWILSLMLYHSKVRDFQNAKSIVEKNKELEKINIELKHMIMKDSMTDLLNHKSSMLRLKDEIDQARRTASPLSVAMLDLDNFKMINDTYGHQIGDEILVQVANIIKTSCRKSDIAGRYGGEEFIIIMPDTDSNEATSLLNRIQKQMIETVYGDGIRVTFSCGISQWNGDTLHSILKKSDLKLYEAKNKGKNRIEVQLNRKAKSAAVK